MYEQFYGLSGKPFQLRPDPSFFFASKGHKRAAAYLKYGLLQEEGFIVITGEIGAGKTTLLRNLFQKLPPDKIIAAQIVNTHVSSDDLLRMVAGAFGLPYEDATQATLLSRLENFLRESNLQGRRALLVVDEAQNLTQHSVEVLRMLSNFQTNDKALLQTFLLGQPEFRKTLLGENMEQLQQRVIATYHLGPMEIHEVRPYIEHRLQIVGWRDDPSFGDDAFEAIYDFTDGIPRKINTLCDRLLLNGYLEGIRAFGKAEVDEVIRDIQQEFVLPAEITKATTHASDAQTEVAETRRIDLQSVDHRLSKLERSVTTVLAMLKESLTLSNSKSRSQ